MASYCSWVTPRSVTSAMTAMSDLLNRVVVDVPCAPRPALPDHREPGDPVDRAVTYRRRTEGGGQVATGRGFRTVVRRRSRRRNGCCARWCSGTVRGVESSGSLLAARLAAGDDRALAEVFDELGPAVHATALYVLGN